MPTDALEEETHKVISKESSREKSEDNSEFQMPDAPEEEDNFFNRMIEKEEHHHIEEEEEINKANYKENVRTQTRRLKWSGFCIRISYYSFGQSR